MRQVESKTIWIINQYASTPETGMGGRHYHLARELAKKGHTVYLIAASFTHLLRKPPEIKSAVEIHNRERVNFVWIRVPKYKHAHDKKRIFNWFLFSFKLLKLPKFIKDSPGVIFVSSPAPFAFLAARRLSKKYKSRLTFEVRDIWPLTLIEVGGYSSKNLFIRFMQWVENQAYKEADVVISNLPNVVEHMVKHGLTRTKFHWIPNGLDLNENSKDIYLSKDIEEQLPNDKFVIGYTGSMGAANALDALIDAARLLKNNQKIAFVLVGDGKERLRLIKRKEALGLENITFINSIPKLQVQMMLQRFDVCFIGLTKDPLFRFGVSPNKLFDYFYSGKPILYSVDSGKYAPVRDAEAGISVPAENPQAIADAIIKFNSMSSEKRSRLGENGKRYVLRNHDYAKLSEKLEQVLM